MRLRCSRTSRRLETRIRVDSRDQSCAVFPTAPWEYAIRNLFRRPLRTALTFAGLTTVILLVFVVVGFIRGLERSLAVSGDPQTAIVFSLGMGENLEYSSISMSTTDLVAASVEGIQERYGQKYVSPELYLGTEMTVAGSDEPRDGIGARRDAVPCCSCGGRSSWKKAVGRRRAKCWSAGWRRRSSALAKASLRSGRRCDSRARVADQRRFLRGRRRV